MRLSPLPCGMESGYFGGVSYYVHVRMANWESKFESIARETEQSLSRIKVRHIIYATVYDTRSNSYYLPPYIRASCTVLWLQDLYTLPEPGPQ